jgi:hypothetical protein
MRRDRDREGPRARLGVGVGEFLFLFFGGCGLCSGRDTLALISVFLFYLRTSVCGNVDAEDLCCCCRFFTSCI